MQWLIFDFNQIHLKLIRWNLIRRKPAELVAQSIIQLWLTCARSKVYDEASVFWNRKTRARMSNLRILNCQKNFSKQFMLKFSRLDKFMAKLWWRQKQNPSIVCRIFGNTPFCGNTIYFRKILRFWELLQCLFSEKKSRAFHPNQFVESVAHTPFPNNWKFSWSLSFEPYRRRRLGRSWFVEIFMKRISQPFLKIKSGRVKWHLVYRLSGKTTPVDTTNSNVEEYKNKLEQHFHRMFECCHILWYFSTASCFFTLVFSSNLPSLDIRLFGTGGLGRWRVKL